MDHNFLTEDTTMKNDLATIFTRIETAANKTEQVAGQILAEIKKHDAKTIQAFDSLVAEAFKANGWSQVAGRPATDSKLKPAPVSVKLYVSSVRAAYRLELPVLTFETIGALRVAIRKARSERAPQSKPEPQPEELKGIVLAAPDRLTGSIFHDVAVLWSHLPENQQAELEARVRKLVEMFSRKSPLTLVRKVS
jgi:hypothetical protein